jgi:hypothetical protein
MAGTIVTDRIESDASFASKIELASPVLVSNTFAVKSTGGTGIFNIVGANTNTDRTFTLPDNAGDILTSASDLAAAQLTGRVPAANANLGAVLQVVSTAKTDTFSVSLATQTTSSDVTGLNCTLTPSSASNKVLVTLVINVGADSPQTVSSILFCNGSQIAVGDASGNRTRITSRSSGMGSAFENSTISTTFLHSPNSTSVQTYTVRLVHSSGSTRTLKVNTDLTDDNAHYTHRAISTITAMEIAA